MNTLTRPQEISHEFSEIGVKSCHAGVTITPEIQAKSLVFHCDLEYYSICKSNDKPMIYIEKMGITYAGVGVAQRESTTLTS